MKKFEIKWNDLDSYHDFSDGVEVYDYEVRAWIADGLKYIEEKIEKFPEREDYHTSTSSGNTRVSIEAYKESNKETYTIFICVCTAYKQKSKCNVELK